LGTFSYQWLRNGVNIAGETGSTYTLGDADVGSQISVVVSYTDAHGANESVTSAQTTMVADLNVAGTVAVSDVDDTGTTPVPDVINPGTVDTGDPTDLVVPQATPPDTQSSPLPEDTYRSLSSGSTVKQPVEIPKAEAPEAEVSGESDPAGNLPSEKGDVPPSPPAKTEFASLLLTEENLPNHETTRDERSAAVPRLGFRQEGPSSVVRASTYEHLRDSLDAVKQEIASDSTLSKVYLGSALVSSIGLSVGYVVWLLRGGMLLASLLSAMPAWQFLDPLPILARKKDDDRSDDNESLESIVDRKPQGASPKKKTADASSDAEEKRR
jgi:hypothetical protein